MSTNSKKPSERDLKKIVVQNIKKWSPREVTPMINLSLKKQITIVGIPDKEARKKLSEFIKKIKVPNSAIYYSKTNHLHITFVGTIPPNLDIKEKKNELKNIFGNKNYRFHLKGLYAKKRGLSLIAYPDNFDISQLRNGIRKCIGNYGKKYNYLSENIGWISIARFLRPPPPNLIELLKENSETDLGHISLQRIEIIRAVNIMVHESVNEILYKINLKQ